MTDTRRADHEGGKELKGREGDGRKGQRAKKGLEMGKNEGVWMELWWLKRVAIHSKFRCNFSSSHFRDNFIVIKGNWYLIVLSCGLFCAQQSAT